MNTVEAEVLDPQEALAKRKDADNPTVAQIGGAEIKQAACTPQQMRVVEVATALEPAYAKASTLELTDAEIEALMAPFPDEAVEIRPHDGLIYIPHIAVSDRLNRIFKPGKWALVCRRHWMQDNTMYGEYVLLVRGCFVGESIGGHPYIANNPKTNYSDALESTAAEALRRICGKRLSCGSQVWNPEYARQWCHKYSRKVGNKYEKCMTLDGKTAAHVGQQRHPDPDWVSPKAESPAIPVADQEKLHVLELLNTAARAVLLDFDAIEAYLRQHKIGNELLLGPKGRLQDLPTSRLKWLAEPLHWQLFASNVSLWWEQQADSQIPGAEVQATRTEEEAAQAMGKALDTRANEAGVEFLDGILEVASAKPGTTKSGKPFTKYNFKIDGQWLSTFDANLYEAVKGMKGPVRYGRKQGKFGFDLTAISPA